MNTWRIQAGVDSRDGEILSPEALRQLGQQIVGQNVWHGESLLGFIASTLWEPPDTLKVTTIYPQNHQDAFYAQQLLDAGLLTTVPDMNGAVMESISLVPTRKEMLVNEFDFMVKNDDPDYAGTPLPRPVLVQLMGSLSGARVQYESHVEGDTIWAQFLGYVSRLVLEPDGLRVHVGCGLPNIAAHAQRVVDDGSVMARVAFRPYPGKNGENKLWSVSLVPKEENKPPILGGYG